MEQFKDYVLLLLAQFAGGPGPKENNLIRFGLPAILWAVLLAVAWSRQRQHKLPRERLLVWGFGLGLARELFMFSHVSSQLIWGWDVEWAFHISEPLEHALTMAAIVVVAGAFLRYILDDATISRRYLQIGLGTTLVTFLGTWWWWSQYATANPGARFNQTVGGLVAHLLIAVFAGAAIALLSRKKGWLRNTVSLALFFFVVSGFLRFLNLYTGRAYADIICPICNSLHILAIPLLGYVYIREQSIEKQEAEDALTAYREHLEDLVTERTAELTTTNERLHLEITEREQAEVAIAQRNTELATQNAIAATISRSLDLDTILDTALDTVLRVLEMEAGCVFLLEPDDQTLALRTRRGKMAPEQLLESTDQACSCVGISWQAVNGMQPVALNVNEFACECLSPFIAGEGIQTLVSTPLMSKGRAVGALSLGAERPNALPPESLDLLAGIGQQIGMAVENANLYQEAGFWANELTMLHQVSVVLSSTLDPDEIYRHVAEQSAKLVGCKATSIFRWDEGQQAAIGVSSYGLNGAGVKRLRLPVDESPLLPDLTTHRRSIPIEDCQADPRVPEAWRKGLGMSSLLCVPVWSTEKPLAFLFLIDQEKPRRWRANEIELVESFVNRAAVALENAYLHKQLQWAAALEERQRIAAEMHDGLAQMLSYLALRSYSATDLLEKGRIGEALDEHSIIQEAIDQAATEVRRSIASLQESPPPRRALQEWLADAVDEFAESDDLPVDLVINLEQPLFVPDEYIEQIIRVFREALVNVSHHAQARQVVATLGQGRNQIRLAVQDDGQGFDPGVPPADGRDHFGLSIMRARAARIEGRIEIESTPGRGTRVTLIWPQDGLAADQNYHPQRMEPTLSPVPAVAASKEPKE